MLPSEKLCFVQFLHPQFEPSRSSGSKWNSGKHARKYLRADGRYLDGDHPAEGTIEFWGEWEAESVVACEFRRPVPYGPRRAWLPCYEKKEDYRGLQNTDPFVFGRFYYTGCQQHTSRGPTRLRFLSKGSVVLFGSRVGGAFALDTVFVVASWIDHDSVNYRSVLEGQVPDAYWDVTLAPRYADGDPLCGPVLPVCLPGDGASERLYFGATYDCRFEGMFSFVPCLPAGPASAGFSRPTIELPGVVNPDLARKYKVNYECDMSDVVNLWENVVGQVLRQGQLLGIELSVPRICGSVPS